MNRTKYYKENEGQNIYIFANIDQFYKSHTTKDDKN